MLPRNVWLAAPFLVLALVVASFTVTPLWIQRRTAQLREPAYRALASSVEALGALIDMRDQQHRATVLGGPGGDVAAAREARQRLSDALLAYASTRGASPADLSSALQRFLVAAENRNPPALRLASERLSRLLMDELAAEQRRAIAASARLEQIRTRSTRLANQLNLVWALLAASAGLAAAALVRRHQRLTEQVRNLDRERAQELEQFAGRVAHDIVSPLGPVSVGVQYLARKLEADKDAQQAVRLVQGSLDRVAAIVDELLRFARAGARPAPDESADLPRVIDALRDELLPAARQRGVALTLEPAPPVQVACSEAAVLVVLQNLLRNAIKYIGDGPRKLVFAWATVSGGRVRVTVQDTGPGIPAGMERAVFEPYVRVAGSRQPGIGLGLATVKRIVESRRGRVGVSSDPRKGATFWVEFPLVGAG
ncbi:MAG TPA: HAMP domain-containing sensor histidine kinase [Myxococcales bacterium]|nr:HAMP domain-containing sensor histidine kinase [Myxococcales bacterium]